MFKIASNALSFAHHSWKDAHLVAISSSMGLHIGQGEILIRDASQYEKLHNRIG